MLVIGEIGEAAEEVRSGKPPIYFIDHKGEQHIPHDLTYDAFFAPYGDGMKPCKPEGMIVELVDVGLRLIDLLACRDVRPSIFSDSSIMQYAYTAGGNSPLAHFRELARWASIGQPVPSAANTWSALLACTSQRGIRKEFDAMLEVKMEFNRTREKLHGKKF